MIHNFQISLVILLCLYSYCATAQWQTKSEPLFTGGDEVTIAYVTNDEGYTLEIYLDADMVRGRFLLDEGLTILYEDSCPTYQIDNNMANNTSLDGTRCVQNRRWADYNFGEIENNSVTSSVLRALMDGNSITFRFRLKDGDYRWTNFTLLGSTRTISEVIGNQIPIRLR
jgi:hypothetical protein